ncbi:nucleotidyltransferase family protein [Streptomyces solicathayae]|uniref:Nucleotidyltransferase family protein n=1 Tax=Streptomyces solicathayae TaxID=3081768 RepID=A0ABZ0LLP4_9ACTN|nr:nucleotidyltransferase family protein [Streptomyces sp. HUAS YS2]WOX20417.1 nucleotidyltransferase family protein [Streptomyces sp. HUAS YS2]
MNLGDASKTRAPRRSGGSPAQPDAVRHGVEAHGEGLPADHTQAILEATKEIGSLLKSSGCPFALVGSVAAYAHGIPVRLQHDTDFALRRQDADTVVQLLDAHGVELVDPSEDWLIKARVGGESIDLIFALAGQAVTAELLDRAEILPVDSVRMPVLAATDIMISRLAALSEHHCDFGVLLPVARGLREKVDWDRVRRDTGDAPMAAAFLYLLELLDVVPAVADERRHRDATR